ncbi:MAG: glycosyltransferase family 2 protein [Verrucomicrobia bacterium]|jgi:glycosyltransferase involved in cell wall biosynthesis|nr:glycosyltransferase family 2 protein [Verrucomicrobiota bacterium]MBT7068568.1 glycosyltransferase family 2 protein [Verrucomicrobiota bacterium]MBT7699564.1 glycosyltransferase family 2 protein [Verrucomicrobiota bacterium]
MWKNQRVSIVLPTYNEKESIQAFIRDLEKQDVIDEIIVVNNNAAPGTSEEVAPTSAREVIETEQGYGAAIQRGFREASGDLVVLFEPDATFLAHDIYKMLAYADDFEVVYGSRTVKELIWQGANMGLFLKWGNYAVAKLMEFLFNTTNLTDVGCTVRCIRRKTLEEMQPFFTVKGSFFGPEMMVISISQRRKIIQIPVNYVERVGHSAVTGNKWVAFLLGLKMINLVVTYRIKSWLKPGLFKTG